MREAKSEIMFGDIDLIGLEHFLTACVAGDARIVHTKVVVPPGSACHCSCRRLKT